MPEEDVMDLLDSLDQATPKKGKKSSRSIKTHASKKPGDRDIQALLDDIQLPEEDTSSPENIENQESKAETAEEQTSAPADHQDPTQRALDQVDAIQAAAGDPIAAAAEVGSTISSWWSRNKGGIWSTATAAATKATEAIQTHADINTIHDRLNSVLNTIVPPISSHEQLFINIFHDMVGYPNIDRSLHEVFEHVMDQVEGGGDLHLIVQKGQERRRVGSDWDVQRNLNAARCSPVSAAKLALASIEDYLRDRKDSDQSSTEQNTNKSTIESGKTNDSDPGHPIRTSELYISIQPVITPRRSSEGADNSEVVISLDGDVLCFVVYLADVKHNIKLVTTSQPFPAEWAEWLDKDTKEYQDVAVDPRDWVNGWIEDGLNLAFGVIAQKYVATRMGIMPGKPLPQ